MSRAYVRNWGLLEQMHLLELKSQAELLLRRERIHWSMGFSLSELFK